MAKKSNFVPDEKMQEVAATGQETLRFHAITEPGFVLECGATPARLGPGGRLRFRTDSGRVMLRFTLDTKTMHPHPTQPYQAACGFDLYVGALGKERYYYTTRTTAPSGDFELVHKHDAPGERFRDFTLHLPLFAKVASLEIGLDADAKLKTPATLDGQPVALVGCDLARGRSASRPGMSLANQLTRLLRRPVIVGRSQDALPSGDYGYVLEIPEPAQGEFKKTRSNPSNKNKSKPLSERQYYRFLGEDADACFTDATHLNDLGLERLAEQLSNYLNLMLQS